MDQRPARRPNHLLCDPFDAIINKVVPVIGPLTICSLLEALDAAVLADDRNRIEGGWSVRDFGLIFIFWLITYKAEKKIDVNFGFPATSLHKQLLRAIKWVRIQSVFLSDLMK